MFANGPEGCGSIPGWVIPKTQKMVLEIILLNTQHYKVMIEGKVEQSREWKTIKWNKTAYDSWVSFL